MRVFMRVSTAVLEALHIVPTADVTTNAYMRDVIGNKADAAYTTVSAVRSLMQYIKGIMGWMPVPTADTINNYSMHDVLGNKADAAQTTVGTTRSIIAYLKGILNYLVTLRGADSDTLKTLSDQMDEVLGTNSGVIVEDTSGGTPKVVAVTSSATANTFGAWVEIDASLSADSWVCSFVLTPTNDDDRQWVFEIGVGAGGSEVTKIRVSGSLYKISGVGVLPSFVYTLPIPIKFASGVRVAVRISDSHAVADAMSAAVQYYQGL